VSCLVATSLSCIGTVCVQAPAGRGLGRVVWSAIGVYQMLRRVPGTPHVSGPTLNNQQRGCFYIGPWIAML
jgi:hypothetical protein